MAALHPKSSKWIVLAVVVGLFVVGGIVLIVKNQSNDTITGQEKLEQQLNIKAAFDHSFKAVQNPLTSTNNGPNVATVPASPADSDASVATTYASDDVGAKIPEMAEQPVDT
eukprot:44203_1